MYIKMKRCYIVEKCNLKLFHRFARQELRIRNRSTPESCLDRRSESYYLQLFFSSKKYKSRQLGCSVKMSDLDFLFGADIVLE